MAYGQKQSFVAPPQPGTTNTPFPAVENRVGGFLGSILGTLGYTRTIPAFLPVSFRVIDQLGLAVENSTELTVAYITEAVVQISGAPGTSGTLSSIESQLANINTSLTRMADQKKLMAQFLSELNLYIAAQTSMVSTNNAMLTIRAQNIIRNNNLYIATSTDTPTMPTLEETLKQAVKDGITFQQQSSVSGTLTNWVNGWIFELELWIKDTSIYKTISSYMTKIKDYILSFELPSLRSTESRAKTQLGIKEDSA